MTYKPVSAIKTEPFLVAYRSTSSVIYPIPGNFAFTEFVNCAEGSTTGRALTTTDAFVVGEVRVGVNANYYSLYDTGIEGGDAIISQGYQVRNNAAGTVVMDDACYGLTSRDDEVTIRALAGNQSDADADANELRLLGIRVVGA